VSLPKTLNMRFVVASKDTVTVHSKAFTCTKFTNILFVHFVQNSIQCNILVIHCNVQLSDFAVSWNYCITVPRKERMTSADVVSV